MRSSSAASKVEATSVASAYVNLTKNLVGAGIFSLPAALLRGSVLPGLGIMLMAGFVQGSSYVLIAFLCQRLGAKTYRGIWGAAFGKNSAVIVDVCITVNSFFACVAYNILVADFLQKALEGLFGWVDAPRSLLIGASTACITLPLSHARNLSPLRYTSMAGLGIIAVVFLYIMSDFASNLESSKVNLKKHAVHLQIGLFSTLGMCTGAFQAHYNAPKIFQELGSDLGAHVRTVVLSFGTAFTFYAFFAVGGLGLFGDEVLGNVLKNYPAEDNTAILMAWLGMAFSIVFTYPLVFTTGRDSLIGLVPALQRAGEKSPTVTHVMITSGLCMVIAALACFVEDVSTVTGLLGATIGSCLCWIFPASIYLKVTANDLPWAPKSTRTSLLPKAGVVVPAIKGNFALQVYAIAMVAVGLLSMCVGIIMTLRN